MRFDVQPLPADETARPFDLAQQVLLNNALIADWAANVAPIVPAAGAQARQVGVGWSFVYQSVQSVGAAAQRGTKDKSDYKKVAACSAMP